MDNAGFFTLGDLAITAAGTYTGPVVGDLVGMSGISFQLTFTYGSGGTGGTAFIQTSVDQGSTWLDLVAISIGTSSKKAVGDFSASATPTLYTNPGDGTTSAETVAAVAFGDRLRMKVVTDGAAYVAPTLLSGRVCVR